MELENPESTPEAESRKHANKQAKIIVDYQRVFGGEVGKRVLNDLFKRFGFTHTTAIANDPHGTYFNEGQRAVILFILERMKMDTTKLLERIQNLNNE